MRGLLERGRVYNGSTRTISLLNHVLGSFSARWRDGEIFRRGAAPSAGSVRTPLASDRGGSNVQLPSKKGETPAPSRPGDKGTGSPTWLCVASGMGCDTITIISFCLSSGLWRSSYSSLVILSEIIVAPCDIILLSFV